MITNIALIILSFILGLFIATTYHFTKKGFSHSQAFIKNLVLLTVVTCTVMMVIGNTVGRAFALIGALSIIRFRTPIKDPLDIGFVFYSIAIGMAIGVKDYKLGITACLLISLLFFIVYRINFGSSQKIDYLIKMIRSQQIDESAVERIMKKYLQEVTLVNIVRPAGKPDMEVTYMVMFKKNTPENRDGFMREMNTISGMKQLIMVNKSIDIEG